jgi:hypothetical protein
MSQLSEQGTLSRRLPEESVETEEALLEAVQHFSGEEYMQVKQLWQVPAIFYIKKHPEKLSFIHLQCDTVK